MYKILRDNIRRMGPSLILLAIIFGFLAIGSQNLLAQQQASINGTVADPSGAGVPGAELVLTNVGSGITRQALSSAQGYFNFTDLSAAQYSLRITAKGFETLRMSGLTLDVGQQMTVQPVLQLGTTTQTVAVTALAPVVTTSSAAIEETIQSSQLVNLPLNGRNPVQLLALTPGMITQTTTQGQFGMIQLSFSAPGVRPQDINFSLDGGTNNNAYYNDADSYPNPDALQEFTVNTRGVSATLGRGSAEVAAQTKSGGNQVHGSAFEFVRNSDMDSRSFFGSTVSMFKRNQFGGTFGGPIIKNKAFFFFSYEGTRQNGGPGVVSYPTLTQAERQGNFSALSTTLKSPPGVTITGNVIPQTSFYPFSKNFMTQYVPPPNDSTGGYYIFQQVATEDQNQLLGHVDYSLRANDRISFLYLFDNYPQVGERPGTALGQTEALSAAEASNEPTRHQLWILGYTHIFTPTILNTFHAAYNRDAFGIVNPATFPNFQALGLPVNYGDVNNALGPGGNPRTNVSGFWNEQTFNEARDRMPMTEFDDMLSWVKGAHTLRLGAIVYRNRINQTQNYLVNGNLTFNGFETGNAGADFLLGYASQFQQAMVSGAQMRMTIPSFYVQDDYRVTRRLTLNLGLRWDPTVMWHDQNGALATFIPGKQSTTYPLALPGMLYPGDAGLPNNIVGGRYDDVAPRLGIAWDVFGTGKTAVRASFGTFFIPNTEALNMDRFCQIPPFDENISVLNTYLGNVWSGPPWNGVNPFPFPLPSGSSGVAKLKTVVFPPTVAFTAFALPFKTPVNQEWSLSVQQAIGKNGGLEVAYIGSAAADQFTSSDGNVAIYSAGATSANIQSRRLDPLIGAIESDGNSLASNYEALQVTFREKYAKHFTLLATYTWSQELGITAPTGEGGLGTRDPFDAELDYGRIAFNVAQNWVTSFIWDLPFGEHSPSRFIKTVVAGWQVNAINTVYSGLPLTVKSGKDPALNGDNLEDADLVGSPKLPGGRSKAAQISEWFNTAAFAQPATGTYGTAGASILTAPGLWDTDFAMFKVFNIREGLRFQIRGEFYNIFNHAALGPPNTTLSNGSFGKITSTGNPRVVELGAHLEF
jgi:hypothetical protein